MVIDTEKHGWKNVLIWVWEELGFVFWAVRKYGGFVGDSAVEDQSWVGGTLLGARDIQSVLLLDFDDLDCNRE